MKNRTTPGYETRSTNKACSPILKFKVTKHAKFKVNSIAECVIYHSKSSFVRIFAIFALANNLNIVQSKKLDMIQNP